MNRHDLKLSIFSFDYPPDDGGISRLCCAIAEQCARNVNDTLVLTRSASKSAGPKAPPTSEIRVTARRPWREWDAFRALRKNRSTPVISGIWYPEGLVATLAGVRPRIILAHGSELMRRRAPWRRAAWRLLQRWTLTSADLVIANSEYTRRLVLSDAPESNVVAIPLGVDTVKFCPGDRLSAKLRWGVEGKTVISTVARLHPYKGHDVVLDALAALPLSNRSNVVYLIAGRGPDRPRIEARVRQLGLDGAVHWLDYVADDDLPDLYRASDLFVLCTRESTQDVEGFGLALLEAQACATPVIGTRTGGIPDAVVDGQGGWLIAQDDSASLAQKLSELTCNPELFRLAGLDARARVERDCTWERYWSRLVVSVNTLMSDRNVPVFSPIAR